MSEAVGGLGRFSAATLHEAMGKRGALPRELRPLAPGTRLCGAALTAWCPPGDNLTIYYALHLAQPGDVLVVDAQEYCEAGPWGEILTAAALGRGVAGLVLRGSVRDSEAIVALGFPVFCLGRCIRGTTKQLAGRVQLPLPLGDVVVQPGDFLVGDDDGLVCIPRDRAEATIRRARAREAGEAEILRRLRAGESFVDLLGLKEAFGSFDEASSRSWSSS